MATKEEKQAALLEVLRTALKFSALGNLGVSDILYDPATQAVALSGDALRLQLMALERMIGNNQHHMDYEWAGLFGIEIERAWHGIRPTIFMDEMHISDFVANLDGAICGAYKFITGEELGEIDVRINPVPGYPWTEGKTTEIYSARRNKWFRVPTPSYLTTVKTREGMAQAVDFCALAPRIDTPVLDGEIGVIESAHGPFSNKMAEYMVTHSTAFHGSSVSEIAEELGYLKSCGGLAFPSLATGEVPATNFGYLVFVCNVSVPLLGMRPYKKKKGAWQVVTYSSDVWTETTREMFTESAAEAFVQLHGSANLTYTSHWHILGPPVKATGFGGAEVQPITSTLKLASVLRRKFKMWTRDMSYEEFERLSDVDSPDRYGYLETKVNGIVDWSMIPFAVCPRPLAEWVFAGLKSIGFPGELLTVHVDDYMLKALTSSFGNVALQDEDWTRYQYAWLVADEIRKQAKFAKVVSA